MEDDSGDFKGLRFYLPRSGCRGDQQGLSPALEKSLRAPRSRLEFQCLGWAPAEDLGRSRESVEGTALGPDDGHSPRTSTQPLPLTGSPQPSPLTPAPLTESLTSSPNAQLPSQAASPARADLRRWAKRLPAISSGPGARCEPPWVPAAAVVRPGLTTQFPLTSRPSPHQQRCKGRSGPGLLEATLPISPTLPSPSPRDAGDQRGTSSPRTLRYQVVPAPVGGADVSGALRDQGHVQAEGTWGERKEGVGEQLQNVFEGGWFD